MEPAAEGRAGVNRLRGNPVELGQEPVGGRRRTGIGGGGAQGGRLVKKSTK
jgi:hypothetical protein